MTKNTEHQNISEELWKGQENTAWCITLSQWFPNFLGAIEAPAWFTNAKWYGYNGVKSLTTAT